MKFTIAKSFARAVVGGKAVYSKSPKATGHYDKPFKMGTTRSGKDIYSHHDHAAHAKFSAHDHMDAYHAHARHAQSLDSDAHKNLFSHHKNHMLHHWKAGTASVKKCMILEKAHPHDKMKNHHFKVMSLMDQLIHHGHDKGVKRQLVRHAHQVRKHHGAAHKKKHKKFVVKAMFR